MEHAQGSDGVSGANDNDSDTTSNNYGNASASPLRRKGKARAPTGTPVLPLPLPTAKELELERKRALKAAASPSKRKNNSAGAGAVNGADGAARNGPRVRNRSRNGVAGRKIRGGGGGGSSAAVPAAAVESYDSYTRQQFNLGDGIRTSLHSRGAAGGGGGGGTRNRSPSKAKSSVGDRRWRSSAKNPRMNARRATSPPTHDSYSNQQRGSTAGYKSRPQSQEAVELPSSLSSQHATQRPANSLPEVPEARRDPGSHTAYGGNNVNMDSRQRNRNREGSANEGKGGNGDGGAFQRFPSASTTSRQHEYFARQILQETAGDDEAAGFGNTFSARTSASTTRRTGTASSRARFDKDRYGHRRPWSRSNNRSAASASGGHGAYGGHDAEGQQLQNNSGGGADEEQETNRNRVGGNDVTDGGSDGSNGGGGDNIVPLPGRVATAVLHERVRSGSQHSRTKSGRMHSGSGRTRSGRAKNGRRPPAIVQLDLSPVKGSPLPPPSPPKVASVVNWDGLGQIAADTTVGSDDEIFKAITDGKPDVSQGRVSAASPLQMELSV